MTNADWWRENDITVPPFITGSAIAGKRQQTRSGTELRSSCNSAYKAGGGSHWHRSGTAYSIADATNVPWQFTDNRSGHEKPDNPDQQKIEDWYASETQNTDTGYSKYGEAYRSGNAEEPTTYEDSVEEY